MHAANKNVRNVHNSALDETTDILVFQRVL